MIATDQEILFAVGLGGGRVLGYQGSLCFLACTDEDLFGKVYWRDLDDILPIDKIPTEIGVYIWKGEIEHHFGNADGDYPVWTAMRGETRTAWPEDLGRLMGKYDPLPEYDYRS